MAHLGDRDEGLQCGRELEGWSEPTYRKRPLDH